MLHCWSSRLLPAVIAVVMVIVAGCEMLDPNPGPSPAPARAAVDTSGRVPPPADTSGSSYARGVAAYAQYCAACHGDSAEGTKIWPTSLQGKSDIWEIVRHGRRGMPAYPGLSDSTIESIRIFLASFIESIDTMNGRQLYVAFCAVCHGDSLRGTDSFPGSIQAYTPIESIVRNGRGDMHAVEVPVAAIAKIQEYMLTFVVDMSKVDGLEYYSRDCARCHGASGEGTTRGYQIRNPVTAFATYVTRNGKPGGPYFNAMPAYTTAKLSDAQLTQMLNWLRSMPKPTDGAGLYTRFCTNCHGDNARGGRAGKNLKNTLSRTLTFVRSGVGGSNYGARGYMPAWKAAELSDQDVSLMVDYIRALP